jgi:methylglutaconyl-CoA hydratase
MKTLITENINNYFVITLNRPEAKNAFDQLMIAEMTETFKKISQDESIVAVILKGAGTAFCSGADLSWMKSMINYIYQENLADSEKLWNLFAAIDECSHVVITQVHGAVFGGALGLIACSDYVFAEEKTKFCFSEVKLGLAPAVISSFILNKCSTAAVKPFMLSAEVFTAQTALQAGLVQQIDSKVLSIDDLRNKFNANGVKAMRATKKLIKDLEFDRQRQDYHKKTTTELISQLRIGEEAQSRLTAFFEKK